MFQQLDWMSVGSRIKYNKAVLAYKALNNLTPTYISELLKPTAQTSCRVLKSSENGSLKIPRSRSKTALYDGSFSYSASKLWNSLSDYARLAPSLNAFKKSVKEYI